MSDDDLKNLFTYHPPKNDQSVRYEKIRAQGLELAQSLVDKCPDSIELDLALMNLQQAIFWANAAIARNE